MTMYLEHLRDRMQAELDKIVGDDIVLKLHNGHPGITGAEHLLFGTGLPKSFTYGTDIGVTWTCEDIPQPAAAPSKWWQPRKEAGRITRMHIHHMTSWLPDGTPLMIASLNGHGGPWTIGSGESIIFYPSRHTL